MYEIEIDVAIIGGGPAGLAAAVAAKKNGAEEVYIIERDRLLGGILQQCIHPGFGIKYYNEELTGPEYYTRFVSEVNKLGVKYLLNTMVLEVYTNGTIICASKEHGMVKVNTKSIILAMGCRERTRGNISVPGSRPAGIYTAGSAQRLVNISNIMACKNIVILGSGDIGMIMARRMTLEGANVIAVVEILDYIAGLTRNKVQCLDDYGIDLLLSHTITKIVGNDRVEGVYIAQVDDNKKPILDTEKYIECDTVLFSVGLIPENELSKAMEIELSPITNGAIVNQFMQTNFENVFACGNVLHVNDLVDNVSIESAIAGECAALYINNKLPKVKKTLATSAGENVRYICPQKIDILDKPDDVALFFRVTKPILNAVVTVHSKGNTIITKKILKANPGEMEDVVIKSEIIAQLDDTITIDVSQG